MRTVDFKLFLAGRVGVIRDWTEIFDFRISNNYSNMTSQAGPTLIRGTREYLCETVES